MTSFEHVEVKERKIPLYMYIQGVEKNIVGCRTFAVTEIQ